MAEIIIITSNTTLKEIINNRSIKTAIITGTIEEIKEVADRSMAIMEAAARISETRALTIFRIVR